MTPALGSSAWNMDEKAKIHTSGPYSSSVPLMSAPFLSLFVIDGPKGPDFKRGKRINTSQNVLIPSMKQIIEAFGFEHRTVRSVST